MLDDQTKDIPELKRLLADYEKRLAEACDGYVSGNLGLEAYQLVELKINSRIKELRNKILQIENASDNIKFHEGRFTNFFLHIDDLMQDRLEEHVFEELLHSSIKCVKCFYDHIDIETALGSFTLMRHMDGKYRHFPHFTYETVPSNGKENAIPRVLLTYIYKKEADRKLIVDWDVMKIYSQ